MHEIPDTIFRSRLDQGRAKPARPCLLLLFTAVLRRGISRRSSAKFSLVMRNIGALSG